MLARLLIISTCILALAVPAFGVTLDPPGVSVVASDRSSITLQVQAGPSGAPSGFVVEWLPADVYRAQGGWPAGGTGVQVGNFNGVPTLETTADVVSYRLESGASIAVVLGNLFDETGIVATSREELPEGTAYVIRVCATAGDGLESSPPSATLTATTASSGSYDCTLTQGFWKNHPESWLRVASITLGQVTYTRLQLMDIFNRPARGNGLISLAHQLIAAKLNLLLGVTPPAEVEAAIEQADALIGTKVVPPVGSGALTPGLTAALTKILDTFNSGSLGPGHCEGGPPVSVRPQTWGTLKSMYR